MTQQAAAPSVSGGEARRAARNAAAIAAARLLSSAALFGWQLVLGGWLGAREYGVYGTVGALFAVGVPLASLSMGMIVIRDVARAPERAGRYLTAALVVQTALALAAYVAMNGAAALLGFAADIRAYVALAGLSLFVDMLGNLGFDQLIARERMVTTSVVDVAHILLRIALAALALVAGYGLLGVYLVTLATGLVRAALLLGALRRAGVRAVWPLDRPLARALVVNSAPLAAAAFLSLAYQHADKLMTTRLVGETGTGYLQAAFVIIYGVVELLSTTILIATYPMMSRAHGERGQGELFGFIVGKLAFFTLVAALPLALVLSLFAPPIAVPLFGEDFRPAADVLRVLIWYAAVTMVANVFAQGYMVQNRQRRLLAVRAGGLALNVALNLVLIPRVGVVGAALASVLAECVVLTALLGGFRAAGWNGTMLTARAARLVPVAAVAGLVMAAAGALHPLAGMAAGLAVYGAALLLARVFAADDLDLLYRLAAAMPGGGVVRRVWRRDVPLTW